LSSPKEHSYGKGGKKKPRASSRCTHVPNSSLMQRIGRREIQKNSVSLSLLSEKGSDAVEKERKEEKLERIGAAGVLLRRSTPEARGVGRGDRGVSLAGERRKPENRG